MAKVTTITADGDYAIATVHRRNQASSYMATVNAGGTWGGGTITWKASFDGGSTKYTLKDQSGADVTSLANDMFNVNMGNGTTLTDAPILYASMSGSTSPSLTVTVVENN